MNAETGSRGLVAPSDIAELAGVSRAAVSNWRKRSTDFPKPSGGTEAKPLFDRDEITIWLHARGYQLTRDHGEVEIFGLFNALRGRIRIETMAALLLSMLCARKLSAESTVDNLPWIQLHTAATQTGIDALPAVTREFEATDKRWADLISLQDYRYVYDEWRHLDRDVVAVFGHLADIINKIAVENLAAVGDHFLARVVSSQARSGGEHGLVGSRTSQLLVNVASGARGIFYDPACGIGEALIGLWTQRGGEARVVGHDINHAAAQFASQRCFLHGVPAEITKVDVLLEDPAPDLLADVVVIEPPFGMNWKPQRNLADPRWIYGTPSPNSSELAWIQHAVAHLAPEGRAYVITSMSPLFKTGAPAAIRSGLLRDGCIEAVIGLPGKMLPHTSISLALWVLRRPGASATPGVVLLVDGATSPDPENQITSWLELGNQQNADGSPPYVQAQIVDLIANDADLNPRRWVEPADTDPTQIAEKYVAAQSHLQDTLNNLVNQAAYPTMHESISTPRILAVRDLVQQEAATLQQGRTRLSDAQGSKSDPRIVTASDIRDGLQDLPNIERSDEEDDNLTRSGDILVSAVHKIRAVVDHHGGRVLAPGVYRLRLDTRQLHPDYIAYCLGTDWNARFFRGTTIQRADVKDLEIPLVPLGEQEAIVAALNQAQRMKDQALTLAEAANAVAASLLEAVRFAAPLYSADHGTPPKPRGMQ